MEEGVQAVIRGFVAGVIWGGVVAAAGLAVMSQVAPLPQAPETAPIEEIVVSPPEAEAAPAPAPEAAPAAPEAVPEALDVPEILQKGPVTEADPEVVSDPTSAAEAPVAEVDPQEDAIGQASDQKEEITESAAAPSAAPPVAPAVPPAAPSLQDLAEGGAAPQAPPMPQPPLVQPLPVAPAAPMAEVAPPAPEAPPPALSLREEPLLTPAPQPEMAEAPASVAPVEPAPVEPAPVEPAPDEPVPGGTMMQPQGTLANRAAGVTTDRLPRIGDAPAEAPAEVALEEVLEGATPLDLFARPFENAEGKPLFALLLIDEGADAALRAEVAQLPFPVTFVLDPLMPDSAGAAMAYRAAGQEVAMLASGIPAGATAMDMEQSFQAMDMALPEAVAVVDAPEGGFQDSLDLARQAVPILADQGRGLLTYDRGLNPADQVARREGVPRGVIFRVLDSEGESVPKMRNYLDRAAFKAAQEGKVIVIGRLRPATLAAILEWSVEGRGASVALAPASAVLDRPASN